MPIDLERVINSRFAVSFVSLIAGGIPQGIAYPICDNIGSWIATRSHSKLTKAYRLNQWVVRGANLTKEALDRAVQETLRNNARDVYDLYHYIQNPEATQRMISLSPQARDLIERPEFANRGLMILGLHLSNFDFILQTICQQGLKVMVLTIPDPQGGRRAEYERRKKMGMNLVPGSVSALRQAVRHLERGGMVLTGIDRPVSNPRYRPRFFGYPAALPTEYIYLASKARVPAVIMSATRQTDGKYYVMSSEPIEMEAYPDHQDGIMPNAEKVLKRAEDFIRQAPWQWNVPLPVWPELLEEVPN